MSSEREMTFMRRAIEIASDSARAGTGPFGAIVVRGDEVLAEGANQVTSLGDPTAHAEILAIRRACEALGTFGLGGCELFSSCEPCPMCLGAIYWARLDRVYYAATRSDAAAAGFDDEHIYREIEMPAGKRGLPSIELLRPEGLRPLEIWLGNDGRIPY